MSSSTVPDYEYDPYYNGTETTPSFDKVTATNHGGDVIIVAFMLLAIMMCVYLTRIYIRLRVTPWGVDDIVVTAGTLAAIIQVALTCAAVQAGFGKKIFLLTTEQIDRSELLAYISSVFYILALGLSKAGTAVLILRLTRTLYHQIADYAILAFTAAWTIASIFVVTIRGDVHDPWLTWEESGSDLFARWLAIESMGMVIELALVGLALALVLVLQMRASFKAMIIGAFLCRILAIIPAGLRLNYLRPSYVGIDPTFNLVTAAIISQVAMHYCLIAASIPCLKPFIQPFDSTFSGGGEGYAYSNTTGMFPTKSLIASQGSNVVLESITSGNDMYGSKEPRVSVKGKGKGKAAQDFEKAALQSNGSVKSQTRWGNTSETWTKRGVRLQNPADGSLRPDVGETVTVVEHSPVPPLPSPRTEQRSGMVPAQRGVDPMYIRQTKEYEVRFDKAKHVLDY